MNLWIFGWTVPLKGVQLPHRADCNLVTCVLLPPLSEGVNVHPVSDTLTRVIAPSSNPSGLWSAGHRFKSHWDRRMKLYWCVQSQCLSDRRLWFIPHHRAAGDWNEPDHHRSGWLDQHWLQTLSQIPSSSSSQISSCASLCQRCFFVVVVVLVVFSPADISVASRWSRYRGHWFFFSPFYLHLLWELWSRFLQTARLWFSVFIRYVLFQFNLLFKFYVKITMSLLYKCMNWLLSERRLWFLRLWIHRIFWLKHFFGTDGFGLHL